MRENLGRKGRVSKGFKTLFAAFLAFIAVGMFTTANANAAQELKLTFNDAWIGLPSLAGLGAGSFHAIDPADDDAPTMNLSGDLAPNGDFSAPAEAFSFPTQVIDAGAPIGEINLDIVSREPITGNYDRDTGAFNASISLRLEIVGPALSLNCKLEPLNIPLSTTGSYDFGDEEDGPNVKEASPFANGNGAAIGSWTGVGVDNVSQVPPAATPEEDVCKLLIGGIIENAAGEGETPSFDGTIWLGGTAEVIGELPVEVCPDGQEGVPPNCTPIVPPKCAAGETGTPPNCKAVVKRPRIGSVRVGKAKVRAGKRARVRVTVRNTGNAVFNGRINLKSNKRFAKVKKAVKVRIPAGKARSVVVVVATTRKARGRVVITARTGGKAGKGVVNVQRAKKKRR